MNENHSNEVTVYIWPEADGLPSSSPYCLKVLYALAHKKIPYQIELVTKHFPDWVRSGKLPAAVVCGEKIEDSTAILKALDRHFPDSTTLYPHERKRLAKTNLIEEWADESLALQLVYHRWAVDSNFERFLPQVFGPTPSDARDQAVKAARDYHFSLFEDRGIAFLSQTERQKRFFEQLDILEEGLLENSYLTGPNLTAADFAAFAPLQIIQAARLPELQPLIEEHARVSAWLERMKQEPAIQDVLSHHKH